MQIEILAIGRARAGPERELYQTYADRIRWTLALRELEEKRRLPPAELKAREGVLLLEALPRDAAVVALDETGKELSSVQFAKQLGRWRDDGRATVAFVIGGADGLTGAADPGRTPVPQGLSSTDLNGTMFVCARENIYNSRHYYSGMSYR
jgi:23S rRNA (pseudouridine1915-N3)-methyltransferase